MSESPYKHILDALANLRRIETLLLSQLPETEQLYQTRFGMSKEEYEKEEAEFCAEYCIPDEDTPKVVFGEVKKSGARKPTRSTKDWP